jgi:hypothetical protein
LARTTGPKAVVIVGTNVSRSKPIDNPSPQPRLQYQNNEFGSARNKKNSPWKQEVLAALPDQP